MPSRGTYPERIAELPTSPRPTGWRGRRSRWCRAPPSPAAANVRRCYDRTSGRALLANKTHHVHDADVSIAEHDGVGRVGHWEEEGEGCGQGGGDQDVQRVDVDGLRLEEDPQTHMSV